MGLLARVFYDPQTRRLGPLLRGHFLLFDQRQGPKYPARTGLVLLLIFVSAEYVIGPRAHILGWFDLVTPPGWLRVLLLLALVVLAARFLADD